MPRVSRFFAYSGFKAIKIDTVNCKFGQHELRLLDRIEEVRIIFRTSALGFALSTGECISYAAFFRDPHSNKSRPAPIRRYLLYAVCRLFGEFISTHSPQSSGICTDTAVNNALTAFIETLSLVSLAIILSWCNIVDENVCHPSYHLNCVFHPTKSRQWHGWEGT